MTYMDALRNRPGRPVHMDRRAHIGHALNMPNNLKFWLDRRGVKLEALAAELGTTVRTIQRLRDGERNLTTKWIDRFAKALDIDPVALIAAQPLAGDQSAMVEAPPAAPAFQKPVPVYRTALCDSDPDGFLIDTATEPVDLIHWPAGLARPRDLFAFRVICDANEPRFRRGDLLFVAPHRPVDPNLGRAVLAHCQRDPRRPACWYLGIITDPTSPTLSLMQHNRATPVTCDKAAALSVQKVLSTAEIFGL